MLFEKASRWKVRFGTPVGLVSADDLWDFEDIVLDELAIGYDEQLDKMKRKSYIDKQRDEDKLVQLKRDIVVYILEVKATERQEAVTLSEKKANKAKYQAALAAKQDEKVNEMSIEELQAKIADC
jgi:hypothetical protein